MLVRARTCAAIALFAAFACDGDAGRTDRADAVDGATDAGARDAAAGADAGQDAGDPDLAARCAILCEGDAGPPPPDAVCFGDELTDGFGRIDGTLLAVQGPTDTQCALPNDDHLIVQVLLHGAAYRMVVNILSDGRNGTDTRLRFADVAAALPAPAWQDGWHTDAPLDYASTLGVHDGDAAFTPTAMDDLVAQIGSRLQVGAPISVYATSDNRPNAAHLVHRNGGARDGAIVVGPTSADPHFLLLHFDGQSF